VEAIAAGEMTDLEGFDSQYGALFGDLAALARALGAGPDAGPHVVALAFDGGGRLWAVEVDAAGYSIVRLSLGS
jgi:hypothetical protein